MPRNLKQKRTLRTFRADGALAKATSVNALDTKVGQTLNLMLHGQVGRECGAELGDYQLLGLLSPVLVHTGEATQECCMIVKKWTLHVSQGQRFN